MAIGIIFILKFYENIRTDDNGNWKSPSCNNYTCDNLLPVVEKGQQVVTNKYLNNLTDPPSRPQRHD